MRLRDLLSKSGWGRFCIVMSANYGVIGSLELVYRSDWDGALPFFLLSLMFYILTYVEWKKVHNETRSDSW